MINPMLPSYDREMVDLKAWNMLKGKGLIVDQQFTDCMISLDRPLAFFPGTGQFNNCQFTDDCGGVLTDEENLDVDRFVSLPGATFFNCQFRNLEMWLPRSFRPVLAQSGITDWTDGTTGDKIELGSPVGFENVTNVAKFLN